MNNGNYNGKTYAYVSIALTAASVISTGLAFTVMGIYALIAAVLLSIASLSFAGIQKRKNNFGRLIIIRVCAYVALGVSAAFFIGGIIWASV